MMIGWSNFKRWAGWLSVLWLGVCFLYSGKVLSGEVPPKPMMPGHWQVVADFQVPAAQVEALSSKLGADLSGVRNTIFEVEGKRVQVNVIVTPDPGSADKLIEKLKSMKAEEGLLRKGLVVYEFVGQNDVLPLIAEGRKHLASK